MKRIFLKLAAVTVISALVSACGGDDDDPPPQAPPSGNIVEIATSAGLTSLLAAATKAELGDELSAASANFTVFAPTNAAFDTLATQLGFADGPALVAALDGPTLAKILSYHVLPARRTAADLTATPTQPTIYNFPDTTPTTVTFKTTGGGAVTDEVLLDAKVTSADVAATNGVVHVIDKVLVPPGVLNIVQMAKTNPGAFSTLVGAVDSAGLVPTLDGTTDPLAKYTVFAPTNDAFAAISTLVAGLTPTELTTVLTYHVLADEVLSTELGPVFGTPVATVSGQTITITAGTAPVIATIADAVGTTPPSTIVAVDVRASNGVIHVIDKVLIPSLTAP
jgi:uncharacterized surface protein with fasciclin (FAS1) repeats